MEKISLQIVHWYACELIGDEFAQEIDLWSYNPICIDRLTSLKKENSLFGLDQVRQYITQTITTVQQKTPTSKRFARDCHAGF